MKKILALILAALMVLTMFACAAKTEPAKEAEQTTTTEPAEETTPEETAPAAEETTEEPAVGGTISVFATSYTDAKLEVFQEIINDFMAETGVQVDLITPGSEGEAQLKTMMASNSLPDVWMTHGWSLLRYSEYLKVVNDQPWFDTIDKDSLAGVMADENGNFYALGMSMSISGLIYNKDCFEKAGIDKLPTNMDELEEACKKLKDAGITPFALAAKETWVLGQVATHFMIDKDKTAAETVDAIKSGETAFADMPNWENLYKFLDLAVEYGPDKPLEVDWETSENMLANGDAAMIHMGDWCQSTLDSFNPDANLAFLPFPVGAGEDDATVLSSCNWTYIVNKDSKNLDLAKEYCEFILTSEEGQKWMAEGVGAVPGAKSDMEVTGALANDAKTYIDAGKTNGWIHTIAPGSYADECGPYLQSYMLGDMSADEVTQLFQDFWTSAE